MKYIYIAGLEHSGTTMINHLLSQCTEVLGLGEVTPFFSKKFMTNHFSKWGSHTRFCSCGNTWQNCPFWGGIVDLNGLNSDIPILEKYQKLIAYCKNNYPETNAISDSSKNLETLKLLIENCNDIGLKKEDFFVAFAIKDVRSFSESIIRKKERQESVLTHLKHFNWWLYANKQYINYFKENNIPFYVVLYEKLCIEPRKLVNQILNRCKIYFDAEPFLAHNYSHIALGNHNFIHNNRAVIKYDYRWFLNDNMNFAYLIHYWVRRFNKQLYFE